MRFRSLQQDTCGSRRALVSLLNVDESKVTVSNTQTGGGYGEKTALFEPFIYKMHDFTKTGSGQTLGKLKKSAGFPQAASTGRTTPAQARQLWQRLCSRGPFAHSSIATRTCSLWVAVLLRLRSSTLHGA
jgi:hypothetical protein